MLIIGIEMLKRHPEKKQIKPHFLLTDVYRFMDRFNLSLRKKYNILPENIINMNETAISYNMPNNVTVHKIGCKTISIKAQRQEKIRFL